MFSLILLGCVAPARAQAVGDMAAKPVTLSNSLQQASEPTGVDRCVFCHLAEVQGYARSAMAHALRPAGQEPDGTVIAHGTKITIHSSPTGFWQTWENAGDKVNTALTK